MSSAHRSPASRSPGSGRSLPSRRRELFLAGFFAACAGLLGGCLSAVNKQHLSALSSRAEFDLNCSVDQMRFTPLSSANTGVVTSYGIKGCGQRRVYVLHPRTNAWLLNSADGVGVAQGQGRPPG